MRETETFYSSFDPWIAGILMLIALILAWCISKAVRRQMSLAILSLVLVPGLAVMLLVGSLFVVYEVDDAFLRIRGWPLHDDWIPIDEIDGVEQVGTRNNSSILSAGRLRVHHAGRSVLVSPRDERAFTAAIMTRQTHP